MRVALVYGGQPRFRPTFLNALKQLEGFEEAHLYLYLWKDYENSTLFNEKGTMLNEQNINDRLVSILPEKFKLIKLEQIEVPTYDELVPKEVENLPRSSKDVPTGKDYIDRFYKQHYGIYKAFKLIEEQYDCIIRFRVDCYLNNNINLSLLNINDGIYMPMNLRYSEYQDICPPVNDQYAIGNMNNMKIYCSLFEHMTDYFKTNHRTFHLETALSYHLLKNNIKIFSLDVDNIIVRN